MRQEFTKRTKLLAFQRSNGHCFGCGVRLSTGNIEYHHDKECAFGGGIGLDNCIVLCKSCHAGITRKQAKVIAKSNRVRAKHLGIARKRSSFATNRDSKFKKKISGEVVLR